MLKTSLDFYEHLMNVLQFLEMLFLVFKHILHNQSRNLIAFFRNVCGVRRPVIPRPMMVPVPQGGDQGQGRGRGRPSCLYVCLQTNHLDLHSF